MQCPGLYSGPFQPMNFYFHCLHSKKKKKQGIGEVRTGLNYCQSNLVVSASNLWRPSNLRGEGGSMSLVELLLWQCILSFFVSKLNLTARQLCFYPVLAGIFISLDFNLPRKRKLYYNTLLIYKKFQNNQASSQSLSYIFSKFQTDPSSRSEKTY